MKQSLQPTELRTKLESGVHLRIVDVRPAPDYAASHLSGAVNVPLETIGEQFPEVLNAEPVVLVCDHSSESESTCLKLVEGHDQAFSLAGDVDDWRSAGLRVEDQLNVPKVLNRQTHLVAGMLLVTAFLMYRFVSPGWIYLALLPTFGLLLDAFTGVCPMTLILRRMPWNRLAS